MIRQMTRREKCEFLSQKSGTVGKAERLGREGLTPQDNPRGGEDYYRLPAEAQKNLYHPVALPSMTNIGMTWSRDQARRAGKIMALMCKGNPQPVKWLFRPGVNIKRSPLCGRGFEYVSEDPVLSGQMGGYYIRGVQGEGVAACIKHYAVNSQEYQRMTTNAVVSERALKEIYLKAFEEAFRVEQPWTLMTSYNRVNGKWVHANPRLMDYLRKELNFQGVVVSDWVAVHHEICEAHEAGMDVETAPAECHVSELEEAVEDGRLDEKVLDASVSRILQLEEKTAAATYQEPDLKRFHEISVGMAADSIVLLQNVGGELPLKKEEKVLVIGGLAKNSVFMGYGSGHMNGYFVTQPYPSMCAYSNLLDFEQGYEQTDKLPAAYPENPELIRKAAEKAKGADKVVIFAGYFYGHETEGEDRTEIMLPKPQRDLMEAVLQVSNHVSLVVTSGTAVDISAYKDRLKVVLYAGLAGEGYGQAVADILYGVREPGGRLAETFPLRLEDTPAYLNFGTSGDDIPDVVYGEDIYVGYRYYDKRKLDVAYPFGHGLSFTSFSFEEISTAREKEEIVIKLRVRNTGERDGSTVIQAYVGKNSRIRRAPRELKTFEKVYLKAGEVQNAEMRVPLKQLRYFSESQGKWILEKGSYDVFLGTSSREIFYQCGMTVESEDRTKVFGEMTPLEDFIGEAGFERFVRERMPQLAVLVSQAANPALPMLSALPIYRLTEPLAGAPVFTEEQLRELLSYMNQ